MTRSGAHLTRTARALLAGVTAFLLALSLPAHAALGTVLNEETLEPVAQAMLTIGNQVATTDEQGRFEHPAAKGSCRIVESSGP